MSLLSSAACDEALGVFLSWKEVFDDLERPMQFYVSFLMLFTCIKKTLWSEFQGWRRLPASHCKSFSLSCWRE